MIPPRMRPSETRHSLKFACAWPKGAVDDVADKLHAQLQWLRSVKGLGGDWFYVSPAPSWRRIPCETVADVRASLAAARELTEARRTKGLAISESQSFYLGPFYAFVAAVHVTQWPEVEGVAAQQLRVVIHPELDVETARLVLLGMVALFKPRWAAANADPVRFERVGADGPVAGWLAFLSGELGEPPPLSPPATVAAAGSMGWVIQAHPDRPRGADKEQQRAVAAVEKGLTPNARPAPTAPPA